MEMIKAVPAAGARERFAAAAQAHTRSMYRAARTILDSDADAEDAVSEALLRAWQAFGRLKSEEALKGWLLKITVNCARIFTLSVTIWGDAACNRQNGRRRR